MLKSTESIATVGAITSFKAVKADTFEAVFDSAQAATASVAITKDGVAVDGTVTWSDDRTSVKLVATAKLSNGEYLLTLTNGENSVTATATVEDEKIASIKILNTVALTGNSSQKKQDGTDANDNSEAYIYYDVLNQYDESIRSSTSIDWSVTSSDQTKPVDDKSQGKLTCTKLDGYTYGSIITVVGVNVQSGISVNETLTIGAAQAVDTIEFSGFVSKNDKTKILDTLPADFAPNTYSLLYRPKDQNGNYVSMTFDDGSYVTNSYVTFITSDPTLVESTIVDDANYTIDDVEYAAVKIEPGMFADKGGDITIKAISNKTGTSSEKTYTIGSNGLLKSLVLEAPSGVVADGDQNIKLNYVATDTNGNNVTSYERIVRSTNSLTLTSTAGTLTVREEANGDAGIYWSDDINYTISGTNGNPYDQPGIADGVTRPVTLSTIVIGGENGNPITFYVSDLRRPDAIQTVDETAESNTIVSGGTLGINYAPGEWDAGVIYLDQYGIAMDGSKKVLVQRFFEQAATSNGVANKNYAIKIDRTLTAGNGVDIDNQETTYGNGSRIINPVTSDYVNNGKVTTAEGGQFVTRYSIASKSASDANAEFTSVSKIKSVTYTAVPISKVSDFTISGIQAKYKLETSNSGNANGSGLGTDLNQPVTGSALTLTGVNNGFTVKGTTSDKVTVTIPSSYYELDEDSDVLVEGGVITAVSEGAIKWNELYDENTARVTRINATKSLKLKVFESDGTTIRDRISASIVMRDELSAPTTLTFAVNATPEDTKITTAASAPVVLDQYGINITSLVSDITYRISDITEATGENVHLSNSFVVSGNGTGIVSITGAEIGDKYTITGTVAGYNVSTKVDVTVGADAWAYVSNVTDKDKDLRKTLGYNR